MTYSFEKIGSDSLYDYLYRCIKNDIIRGTIKAGEKLPSKRGLAKNLNVSVITVENAYAQLAVEGYIYSIEKKGYFVADIQEKVITEPMDLKKEDQDIEERTDYEVDFVRNSINYEQFPITIWNKLMREVSAGKTSEELLESVPPQGLLSLREAIAKHLYEFRGMKIEADQIIIGAGTEYLYNLLIQLLGRKHIYAVEDPSYKKITEIYRCNDVKCAHIAMDEHGVMPEPLEKSQADILHISPSHQYPTGIVMPVSRRYELLSWASKKKERYIIEDDYDCEFRLFGKPIPTLQSIDVMEKVIYMNTFSKSLAPSFRISYMVLSKSLVKLYKEKLSFYTCTVSSLEQYILEKFITEGYFEKHINRMRKYYKTKRNRIIDAIRENPRGPLVNVMEEDSGLHFLLQINTSLSDEELVRKARRRGIRVSCLSEYYQDQTRIKPHILVVHYAGIEDDKIEGAIQNLCLCFA